MAAPVFSGLDDTPAFTENTAPVVLDSDAMISDADLGASDPFTGATLVLARAGGANPDDVLSALGSTFSEGQVLVTEFGFDVAIGSYVFDGGTLTIVFNEEATAARINAMLQRLTYANASEAPPASVQINYTFNNGEQATGSITVGITAADDPPAVSGLTPAFYQPGSAGTALSPGIALADIDSATLAGATVTITDFTATDLLSANVGASGITANYNSGTGILTLGGTASLETYRQVLATVAYSSSAQDPTASGSSTTRSLSWQVNDGSTLSPAEGSTLGFFPVVDLDASAAGTGFAAAFTDGGSPVAVVDSDVAITSGDTGLIAATVILTNAQAGDSLSAPGAAIPFTIDGSVPGRIALIFSDSGQILSETTLETALAQVRFSANASAVAGARDVTVTVTDANNTSNVAHTAITVSATNDPGSATNDSAATAGNTILNVAAAQGVLANDSDPDGLVVITGNVATSQGGAIQFASDGAYTYAPASGFFGTDTVGYTAQDPFGSQVSATLSITVGAVPGTAGDDSFTAQPGNSAIDAAGGIDSITFGFRLVDATFAWSGNQVIIDGPSTHTVLTGFERYVFTDGTADNNDGSPLIDDLFYHARNHDVWNAHVDADGHYNANGWHENRDPNAFFSTTIYLSANPDVRAAGVNPLTHFDQFGWHEGRVPSLAFDLRQYFAANPDVAAANVDPLAHFLANGAQEGRQPFAATELIAANGFDYVYYLQNNPDVAAANVDPFGHFQSVGWQEGRNPNALFDVAGYLATYTDVDAANVNPLDHYHQHGWQEGRDPSVGFDTASYRAAYADVAAANIDPLAHFLKFGIHEGRSPFADGIWG